MINWHCAQLSVIENELFPQKAVEELFIGTGVRAHTISLRGTGSGTRSNLARWEQIYKKGTFDAIFLL